MPLGGPKSYADTWTIGEEVWELRFVRKLPDDSYGINDPMTNKFYIRLKQPRDEMFGTFLHECVHMMDDAYTVGLTETQVTKMEHALKAFLLDNFEGLRQILGS